MSASDDFMGLPMELKLMVFSFLPVKDLNTWRLSCKEFWSLIEANKERLYRKRIAVVMVESFFCDRLWITLERPGFDLKLVVANDICIKIVLFPREDQSTELENQKREASEMFLNQTFEACVDVMTKRSGGIVLSVCGKYFPQHEHNVQYLLNRARSLQLNYDMTGMTKELMWEQFFAPKRPLHLVEQNTTISAIQPIIADFLQHAASGELFISLDPHRRIYLEDDELLAIVNRPDLTMLNLKVIERPTCDGLRRVIQLLLDNTKTCSIKVVLRAVDEDLMTPFTGAEVEVEEDFTSEIEQTRHLTIKYTKAHRRVKLFGGNSSQYTITTLP